MDLTSVSATLLHLAEVGNVRLTIKQAAFFLIVASADARGRPATLKDAMEASEGVLGRSVTNTYKVPLEAEGRNPKIGSSLGWLARETNPRANVASTSGCRDRPVANAALQALGRGG
jgi:hypothetical protein